MAILGAHAVGEMTTLTWMMMGATRLPYSSAWIDVALTPAGTVTLRGRA
jgi:hypothetical protein